MNQYKAIVFVESPKKIKIFEKYLKIFFNHDDFKVFSTNGHIRENEKKILELNADIKIKWNMKPNLIKLIKELKSFNFNDNVDVYIATDADREGEAIGWHFHEVTKEIFDYKKNFFRVYCRELNKTSIVNSFNDAFNKKNTISQDLVCAYLARVYIDLFIGFNGSSILWTKLYGCKSIGRVQSIGLMKIFDREQLIKKFVRKKLYGIKIIVNQFESDNKFECFNLQINDKKLDNSEDEQKIDKILEILKTKKFKISKHDKSKIQDDAIIPLDTGTLSSKLNISNNLSIKETYSICQKLYEGININDNLIGLITYMRTDSNYISPEFSDNIKEYIINNYGEKYFDQSVKMDRQNSLSKQESHESIRVTTFDYVLEDILKEFNQKEINVYKTILYHTVSPFMQKPIYDIDKYYFVSDCEIYKFLISTKNIIFDGFKKFGEDIGFLSIKRDFINFDKENFIINFEKHETTNKQPERYTEGSLVEELKKEGIGRPSTYNYITEVIKKRSYTYINKNKYFITDKGIILSNFINKFFSKFINYKFTYTMEKNLDEITTGNKTFTNVVENFLQIFINDLNEVLKFERQDIIKLIEKMILNNEDICEFCEQPFNLKFIFYNAKICCACKNYINLEKYGYYEQSCLNDMIYYSKKQYDYKKIVNKNKKFINNKKKINKDKKKIITNNQIIDVNDKKIEIENKTTINKKTKVINNKNSKKR